MNRQSVIWILLFVLFMSAVCSCKPHIKYVPVTVTEKMVETIRDTVITFRPVIYRDTITTGDTISFVENEYAQSYARWTGGELSHSLKMKDQDIPIKVQYIEKEKTVEVPTPYPVEVIKEVEKELNLWQKIKIKVGGMALAFISILGIWKIRKILG